MEPDPLRPALATLPTMPPGVPVWLGDETGRGLLLMQDQAPDKWGEWSRAIECIGPQQRPGMYPGASLDLRSPEGWIAHESLVRWLTHLIAGGVVSPHRWKGGGDVPQWMLSGPAVTRWFMGPGLILNPGPLGVTIPALASIPLNDDRLPWGGLECDSLSLIAVVQHFHNLPR